MEDIIDQYISLVAGHAPATPEELKTLEQNLNFTLSEDLRRIYEDRNGDNDELLFRLMPVAEVVECHDFVQQFGWDRLGLRLFWTDDESNYVGLYVSSPLAGKVCYIVHDDQDLSPAFRTLRSFLTALTQGVKNEETGDVEIVTEYPAPESLSNSEMEEDWGIAQALKPLFEIAEDDQERINRAYAIMAITPTSHSGSLIEFTFDDDFYISQRACELLGKRKYEPAVDRLAEVAAMNIPNAPWAARQALAEIATPAALEKLNALKPFL